MKKPIIIAIVLLVLSLGTCTAFFIVKSSQDKKEESKAEKQKSYSLFEFDSDSITSIDINCDDGEYNIIYEDDEWKITNIDNYSINQSYFTNICTFMCSLTAEKDFDVPDESQKTSYGLDSPKTITCSDGKNNYTIYIGNLTPTGENYYVMVEGRKEVFLIDAYYGSVLDANENFIKNNNLIGYTDRELHQVILKRNNETIIDITKDDSDTWNLTKPFGNMIVDNTKVSSITTIITRLTAEKFIAHGLKNYAEYGFDKPYAELYVYNKEGESTHLLFSYFGDDSETYTHILNTETGDVGLYYTYDVDFIEKNVGDILVSSIQSEDIYNVSAIDMNYHGEKINFTVDANSTQFTVNGEDIDALGADACNYFYNFFDSIAYMEFDSIDMKAVPEGDADITIKLTYADGSSRTMEFIKFNDNNYYLKNNGEYTGYIIREKSISGTSSLMYWYDMLISYISEKNA